MLKEGDLNVIVEFTFLNPGVASARNVAVARAHLRLSSFN